MSSTSRGPLLALLVLAPLALLAVLSDAPAEGREGRTRVEAVFSPDGGVTKTVSGLIRDARRTIDVAVYVLSSPSLATDLIAAHKRGVEVRVLLDERMSWRWSQLKDLREHGVRVGTILVSRKTGDRSDPHFHHKFAVIDGKTVITGSFNWTKMAEERNHENVVVIRDEDLAARYTEVFEEAMRLVTPPKEDDDSE